MTAMVGKNNVAAAMSFIRAVEKMDGQEMEGFFSPDVRQVEMPNAYKPTGAQRDLTALKADIEKAKGIIEGQRYEIVNTVAEGDHGCARDDLDRCCCNGSSLFQKGTGNACSVCGDIRIF